MPAPTRVLSISCPSRTSAAAPSIAPATADSTPAASPRLGLSPRLSCTDLLDSLMHLMTDCVTNGANPRRTLLICLLLQRLREWDDAPCSLKQAAEHVGDQWFDLHRRLQCAPAS